jgi:hypothetical protein
LRAATDKLGALITDRTSEVEHELAVERGQSV